jgi:hypothetical protein
MLYTSSEQYTSPFKKNKDPFLILDSSLTPLLHQYLCIRSQEINQDAKWLQERFEDALISAEDLDNKLSAVILSVASFTRQIRLNNEHNMDV